MENSCFLYVQEDLQNHVPFTQRILYQDAIVIKNT